MDAEVIVVGAGPAGCATSQLLSEAGHDVLLLDRVASFPRNKPCGEGLMPHGVAALDALGVLDSVKADGARPFFGIRYNVDGVVADGSFTGPSGLGVQRHLLDRHLVNAAQQSGVRLRLGTVVRNVEGRGGAMRVETRNETLRCRLVLAGDGLRSTVRNRSGLAKAASQSHRYGARAHYALRDGVPDLQRVEVHTASVDGEPVEWYLTPVGKGRINVALLFGPQTAKTFKGRRDAAWAELISTFPGAHQRIRPEPLLGPTVTGPLRQDVHSIVGDGRMLVGDAAGFVDAITGEGMSLALAGARLAAGQASAGLRRGRLSADDLLPYQGMFRRMVRDRLLVTSVVLWGLRKRGLAKYVVRNLGRRPEVFSRLLGVNTGDLSLREFGVGGVVGMLAP